MAAVRAIEHCNTWTTKGRKQWTEFITLYLLDEFTRISFLKRVSHRTFEAIVRTTPWPPVTSSRSTGITAAAWPTNGATT